MHLEMKVLFLMDAAIEEAETAVIAASSELLESREIIDTPLERN